MCQLWSGSARLVRRTRPLWPGGDGTLQGCRNRIEQQRVERRLRLYRLYWPSQADCERAFQDYATYHLSHQLGILDAFIAETAVGLGVTLATFNARYYRVVSALHTLQPYEQQ